MRIFRRTKLGEFTVVDHAIATYALGQADQEAEAARDLPTATDTDTQNWPTVDNESLDENQRTRLRHYSRLFKRYSHFRRNNSDAPPFIQSTPARTPKCASIGQSQLQLQEGGGEMEMKTVAEDTESQTFPSNNAMHSTRKVTHFALTCRVASYKLQCLKSRIQSHTPQRWVLQTLYTTESLRVSIIDSWVEHVNTSPFTGHRVVKPWRHVVLYSPFKKQETYYRKYMEYPRGGREGSMLLVSATQGFFCLSDRLQLTYAV